MNEKCWIMNDEWWWMMIWERFRRRSMSDNDVDRYYRNSMMMMRIDDLISIVDNMNDWRSWLDDVENRRWSTMLNDRRRHWWSNMLMVENIDGRLFWQSIMTMIDDDNIESDNDRWCQSCSIMLLIDDEDDWGQY